MLVFGVEMLGITDVVSYVRWLLQRKADIVFILIYQWECLIQELNNRNKELDQDNSWVESYYKSLKETWVFGALVYWKW